MSIDSLGDGAPGPASARTERLRASPRMFESALLDRASRVHHLVPVVIFLPAVTILAAVGLRARGPVRATALFAAGYVVWTLTEYWLHRLLFHFAPERGLGARLHWLIHGVHHDHPNDPARLVMPPAASVPLSAGFCLAFLALVGPARAPALCAGFLAGYLVYDLTHYALHHRPCRGRVARRLREAHMRHHFQDDTRGFGVSAPYWDRVFRTVPRPGRPPA